MKELYLTSCSAWLWVILFLNGGAKIITWEVLVQWRLFMWSQTLCQYLLSHDEGWRVPSRRSHAWETLWEAATHAFLMLATKTLPGEAEGTLCLSAGSQTHLHRHQGEVPTMLVFLLPWADELNEKISVGGVSPVGKLQLRDASSQIPLNCRQLWGMCVCCLFLSSPYFLTLSGSYGTSVGTTASAWKPFSTSNFL